jgi:hypothetical protein
MKKLEIEDLRDCKHDECGYLCEYKLVKVINELIEEVEDLKGGGYVLTCPPVPIPKEPTTGGRKVYDPCGCSKGACNCDATGGWEERFDEIGDCINTSSPENFSRVKAFIAREKEASYKEGQESMGQAIHEAGSKIH